MNAQWNAALDPAAVAKAPTQARAKQRFETILAEADAMLKRDGLGKFSIPLLAQRLGMTRGSVYAYFPTQYAIFNELAGRFLDELEAVFFSRADELASLPWQDGVRVVVEQAVTYHNDNPVARLLILGGAVTDNSYRAQDNVVRRLGALGRSVWQQQSGRSLPESPDIFALSVDMAVACFRRSVQESGEITPAYQELAVVAMRQFLHTWLDNQEAPIPGDEAII